MARKAWALLPAAVVVLGAVPAQAWRVHGEPPQVQLGLRVVETTDQLRTTLGVPGEKGALVMAVEPEGPAASAGLKAGDVLTRVDDTLVGDAADILEAVGDRKAGEAVRVEYVRDRQAQAGTVTLAAAPRRWRAMGRRPFGREGFGLPPDVQRQAERFRERMERGFRELDQRLRRLEKPPAPDAT